MTQFVLASRTGSRSPDAVLNITSHSTLPGALCNVMARKAKQKAKVTVCRAFIANHQVTEAGGCHGPVLGHPEQAERVRSSSDRLRANKGLWSSLKKLPPRRATDSELQLAHDASHIAGLEKLAHLAANAGKAQFVPHGPMCMNGPRSEIRVEDASSDDTYVTAGSLEAARYAAGGMLQGIDELLDEGEGEGLQRGFVLCRPPGHHASRGRSSGFCLVNNVAIAAAYALSCGIKRVLIFDWDVHHGQGTQQIFEQSDEVLFISFHRHDGHSFYPATGSPFEAGSGRGKGFTVNVALPQGFEDLALWSACAQVLVPATRNFQPDLILVSAGFDAATGDPLGGCSVSPQLFGLITREILKLAAESANGRVLLALEGGYNVDVLAECVEDVMQALVDEADVLCMQAVMSHDKFMTCFPVNSGSLRF